jgi:hypothetical protein
MHDATVEDIDSHDGYGQAESRGGAPHQLRRALTW